MSKLRYALFLVTLMLTNFVVMGDMVIYPSADDLFAFFDNEAAVNFLLSGQFIFGVLSSLAAGPMMRRVSKKHLMTAALVLFAVGGILGIAVENIWWAIGMRILIGLAIGLANTTGVAIIAETFTDQRRRGHMMGVYNSAMSVTGAIIGLSAGYLAAAAGWRAMWQLYWIALPLLALVVFFIPYTPPEGRAVGGCTAAAGTDRAWVERLVAMAGAVIGLNVLCGIAFVEVGVYVAERELGTDAMSGWLTAAERIGAFIACLAFGLVYAKLKRASVAPAWVVMATSMLILYLADSAALVGVGYVLLGAGHGIAFTYYFMRSSVIVPPKWHSRAIGFVAATVSVGFFLTTYVASAMKRVLDVETIHGILPLITGLTALGAVASIALSVADRKWPSEYVVAPGAQTQGGV